MRGTLAKCSWMTRFVSRFEKGFRSLIVPRVVRRVGRDALTFLEEPALVELFLAARRCEQRALPGIFAEMGCAAGGSAIVVAAAKDLARPLYVFDTFGQIPPPSQADGEDVWKRYEIIRNGQATGIGGRAYYGYEPDLLFQVERSFARHGYPINENNVKLIQGLFEDTLVFEGPVAFAHVDGDWYDSVMTCLQRVAPRLVPGGMMIIDDYFAWSGCRKAVDEYFSDKRSEYELVSKSRLHVLKK